MKKILLIAAMAFAATTGFAQQKFAHVNFQELVQLMPDADKARETIQASSAEAQETYQSMLDEFNAKYNTYQQKAGSWTQAIRESKEKELTEIQQRIQEFGQSVQAELQQQEQSLMAPIYQKANDTVKELAKAAGFVYVFDVSTLLYYDETQSVNLTPAARKALGIAEDRTLESLQKELQAKQAAAEPAQK
jgi:outer membrane protein